MLRRAAFVAQRHRARREGPAEEGQRRDGLILTGDEIGREIEGGRIVIGPFDPACLEPNSYAFHLGDEVLQYEGWAMDARVGPKTDWRTIPPQGMVFEPDRLYLARTLETLGSGRYASTLYGSGSIAALGVWIQLSAPLGHTGAIIPWTLEIAVVHPVRLYPGMRIGKVAFWATQGEISGYSGKYAGSTDAVPSRISSELA